MSIRRARPLRSRTVLVDVGLAARAGVGRARARRRVAALLAYSQVNIIGWSFRMGSSRHAQMLRDQRMIVPHVARASCEHDASGIEQHDIVGEREREVHVLL